MAMMEIAVLPVGTSRTSVSPYVAEIEKRLARLKGIRVELTGMGTIVTGPLPALFRAAQIAHATPFRKGVQRVYTVIKIDDRRDKTQTPGDKVASVRAKMAPGSRKKRS